jgi:putative transposase
MSERIDEDLALQALVMALEWRRPTGELMHHSDSNNVSTSFSTARPVTAVVGLPEGLVPRSVPDGLTHTLIDLICCLSPDLSAGREHRTARFHLAAACDPRRA